MPSCSMTECDQLIERALVDWNLHVYMRKEDWEVVSRDSLEIEVCTRNVRRRFRMHSRIAQSVVLPDFVFHQVCQEIGG